MGQNRPTVVYIPPNLDDSGGLLGGQIKTRNLIEAAIAILVIVAFCKLLGIFLPTIACTVVGAVLGLLALIVCLVGVKGEPLSVFILNVINYRKTASKVLMRMPMPNFANKEDLSKTQKKTKKKAKK